MKNIVKWVESNKSKYIISGKRLDNVVYMLYDRDGVCYIGKSKYNLLSRLSKHQFNWCEVYVIVNDDFELIERVLINYYKPIYNRIMYSTNYKELANYFTEKVA